MPAIADREKRVGLQLPIDVSGLDIVGATFAESTRSLNISGGGLCFEATEALDKDMVVALEINSDDFSSAILALARVAWCKPRADAYEIGAEFWWIGWRDHQAQSLIADFIATSVLKQHATA